MVLDAPEVYLSQINASDCTVVHGAIVDDTVCHICGRCPLGGTWNIGRNLAEGKLDAYGYIKVIQYLKTLENGFLCGILWWCMAYLLIEWLERHHGESIEGALAGGGRWGFIPGALLGCVPQCGFSAVASNLYASRVITPGTLLAVFIATSDEAIPLLAAEPSQWVTLVLLLACKVAFAIVGGWLLDIPLRRVLPHSLYGGYEGHADDVDCHEEHEESSSIFMAALRHTLEIFVFILLFSFIISLLFEGFGEEPITAALSGMGIFQPMLTALVGLVPNCAVSVLLAQLYVQGAISFGSLFAGLTAGAGVGLAVLWRVNPSWKQNLFMTGLLWAVGAATGMLLQLLPL